MKKQRKNMFASVFALCFFSIQRKNEKYYVNLKELNALALRQAGVREIAISKDCTVCSGDKYWSHRVVGNLRGSQGAIIVCKEAGR